MTERGRALLVVAAAVLLLATGCGGGDDADERDAADGSAGGAAGAGGEPTTESRAAGDWLAGQLDDGVARNDDLGFDDVGLSIDIATALDAVGGHAETVAETASAVAGDVDSYTISDGSTYAGSTAKALAFLQTHDAAPAGLVGQLEGLVGDDGRVADDALEDAATTIAQAYAVRALVDADSGAAEATGAALLDVGCPDGSFPSALGVRGPGVDCVGDVDTTALVVLNLDPVADEVAGGEEALDEAADWLVDAQEPGGGFAGIATPGVNANSTGLATWVLGVRSTASTGDGTDERAQAATAGAALIADLQVAEGPDAGAVAYDVAAEEALAGAEIDDPSRDQFRRATAQSAPALVLLAP